MNPTFVEFKIPHTEEQELGYLLERIRNVRTLNKSSAKILKELEAELETKFPSFNKLV